MSFFPEALVTASIPNGLGMNVYIAGGGGSSSSPVAITGTVRTERREEMASGTLVGTGSIAINPSGGGSVRIAAWGTFSGTLYFEASVDGTRWANWSLISTPVVGNAHSAIFINNTTTEGTWEGRGEGLMLARVRADITSGSVDVMMNSSNVAGVVIAKVVHEGFVCPQNSTTTPLGANETWTGAGVDTLGHNAVAYSIQTNQVSAIGGIKRQWSQDNVNWFGWAGEDFGTDRTSPGEGQDMVVRCHSRYFRLSYTNGPVSQSFLRIQTVLQPGPPSADTVGIVNVPVVGHDALITKSILAGQYVDVNDDPKYVDIKATPAGNLQTTIQDFRDNGAGVQITPIGDMMVQQPIRMVGAAFFDGVLDSNFWTTDNTGSATVGVTGTVCFLDTGTSSGSYANLYSNRAARFQFAYANKYRSVVRVPDTGTVGNVRRWGISDGPNGIAFELSGSTFGVFTKKDNVFSPVYSGQLNGPYGSTYVVDTDAHAYEIIYFTAGIWFYVDNKLIHSIKPKTTVPVGNLTLPIRCLNQNTGSLATNVGLEIWNASILRLGNEHSVPAWRHLSGTTKSTFKTGPGTLHTLVTNKMGATSDTCSIYDSSGSLTNPIAVISYGTGPLAQFGPNTVNYNLDFASGLTVLLTGTSDYTILFD